MGLFKCTILYKKNYKYFKLKKMNLLKFDTQLTALESNELTEITGGESIWYWVAYGISSGVTYTAEYLETVKQLNSGLVGVK